MAGGAAAGSLVLPASARPTPRSPDASEAEAILEELGEPPEPSLVLDRAVRPTDSRELGPFYRAGAPYRAKVCPPLEPGRALIVTGRVWAHDTKKPIPGAQLDVWQVDNIRRTYSSGASSRDYKNRCRLIASETGLYEFESVRPVAYQPSANFWRSPHIHFIASAPGYKRLVSEIFFDGDEKHDIDPLFLASLVVKAEAVKSDGGEHDMAKFDIILEKA